MPELRKREATLRAELDALDTELHDAETYLKLTETLDAFRARLSANAEKLTIEQRQEIVRLVVREVLLGDDDVTVRHSIPVPTGGQPGGSLLHSQSQGAAQGDQATCSANTRSCIAVIGTRSGMSPICCPSATGRRSSSGSAARGRSPTTTSRARAARAARLRARPHLAGCRRARCARGWKTR